VSTPAEPDIFPVPDVTGHFGDYGGLFAPESLMAAIEQLAKEYEVARTDPAFVAELSGLLKNYAASCSSVRTWRTPDRTRSTTSSARCCSPSGWARPG
jgi:tryptophan synthase beta chain